MVQPSGTSSPDAGPTSLGGEAIQACQEEGSRMACGRVSERHGSYVTCAMGYRTCTNGVWSACQGDRR